MKITEVAATVLRLPTIEAANDSAQDAVVVRVDTDAGVHGIGETDSAPTVVKAVVDAPRSHKLATGLRDALVGIDPSDPRALVERMHAATLFFGRRGVTVHAISAVEMALWDLRGKATGQPVWRLLNGDQGTGASELPDRYGTILADVAEQDWRRVAELVLERDLVGIKVGFDAISFDVEIVTKCLRRARAALGDELDLMVDFSCGAPDALADARLEEWEILGVRWIEEPFPPDRLDLFERLAVATAIPLAAGENECALTDFRRLVDAGITVLQPDVSRCGGLDAALAVSELATRVGVRCVPHSWSPGLIAAATEHCAIAGQWPLIEYGLTTSRLHQSIYRVRGDCRAVKHPPTAPGLGVELCEAAMAGYLVASESPNLSPGRPAGTTSTIVKRCSRQ